MISNIDQLKKLIEWCKSNKIKKLKLKDIEFEISELDFIPEENIQVSNDPVNTGKYNTETLADTLQDKPLNEDEDLFWSSGT